MTMVNLEIINVGQAPNDGTGDTHRDSFQKTNRNMAALKAALEDAFKTVEIPASANLNAYTTSGTFHQSADAGAVGGTNYPEGAAGLLQVVAAGAPFVYQCYVTTARKSYWRTRVGSVWTDWVRMLDASMLGAANGLASLGADSKIPRAQLPVMTALVIVAGTNANTVVDPGSYYINDDADAVLANNWPELRAGTLVVERSNAGNFQVTQTYTTRSGSGGVSRTYKRVRFGATPVWGAWQELARLEDAMKNVALAVGTDANALVAPNTFYTWGAGAVISQGTNWPAIIPGSGALTVSVLASTTMIQSLEVLTGVGRRPICLQRARINGTWDSWYVVSPISDPVDLPSANCGDVYVDGRGWYRWMTSTYDLNPSRLIGSANLNNITGGGSWYQGDGAQVLPGSNYPNGASLGFLTVENYTSATIQTYSNRDVNSRRWWRLQRGVATWSAWEEMATVALTVATEHVTAAMNLNTLPAANTDYSWTSGTVVTGGTGWPPIGGGIASGMLQTRTMTAGLVHQRVTLLGNGQMDRVFARFGTPNGSWESWKMVAPISHASFLPTADCGDVYVSGTGWFRWGGATYAMTRSLVNSSTTNSEMMYFAMGGLATNGAIIELGSNSNGTWIKYGDGTMMAFIHRALDLAGATFTSNGAFSYLALGAIPLPAAFISNPLVVASNFSDNDIGSRSAYLSNTPGANTTQILAGGYLTSPNPSPGTASAGTIRYTLLGRWK